MKSHRILAAVSLATGLFASGTALADAGHDHVATPAATTGSALPRLVTVSESFELVGVLDGKQLTLYLDRFTDNSPVKNARLDVEIGGAKVKLEPGAEGEFRGTLADLPKPGTLALTASVVAGNESDLLAGEFEIGATAPAVAVVGKRGWKEVTAWLVGGLVALGALAWVARRSSSSRQLRAGGSA